MANKSRITIVINNEANDDWMKSLPGYKDELQLQHDLATEHADKKEFKHKVRFIKKH